MHNGMIGGFRGLRRRLLEELSDEAFGIVRGSTDTEHLFAVFVDEIVRNGCPVEAPGEGGRDGSAALELARRLSSAISRVLAVAQKCGIKDSSFLNVAVSDGDHVAVSRFAAGDGAVPESLYMLQGELYSPAGRAFPQQRPTDEGEATVISSERLTSDSRWTKVPVNDMVVLDRWVPPRVLPMDAKGQL